MLRCALLKQYRQLSYEELAFHLEDSASFRAFARLPWGWSPRRSALHQTIGAIRAETWEAVNRTLLASARQDVRARGRRHASRCDAVSPSGLFGALSLPHNDAALLAIAFPRGCSQGLHVSR